MHKGLWTCCSIQHSLQRLIPWRNLEKSSREEKVTAGWLNMSIVTSQSKCRINALGETFFEKAMAWQPKSVSMWQPPSWREILLLLWRTERKSENESCRQSTMEISKYGGLKGSWECRTAKAWLTWWGCAFFVSFPSLLFPGLWCGFLFFLFVCLFTFSELSPLSLCFPDLLTPGPG